MAAAKRNMTIAGYGEKQQVRIITVDKEKSRVECAMRDGAMVWAAVWETPTVFRWPSVGEIWTIRKDTNIWRLDQIVQTEIGELESTATPKTLAELPEGDTRILGDTIYTNSLDTQEVTIGGHNLIWAEASPTTGSWNRGDIVFNTVATSGGQVGWVCTASGKPGTWKTFGLIS